jgi:hypothetical protein
MDDKLLEALKVIKEECKKHDSCSTCPMSVRGDACGIDDSSPNDWKLVPRTTYF